MSDFKMLTGKLKEQYELEVAKLNGNFLELVKRGYRIECAECGCSTITVFKESSTYVGQKIEFTEGKLIYGDTQLQHQGGTEYRCGNHMCLAKSRDINYFIKKDGKHD